MSENKVTDYFFCAAPSASLWRPMEILCLGALVAIYFFATTLALKLQRRRKNTKSLRFTKA